MGAYGIYWNDDLDIEAETIYEDGKLVGKTNVLVNYGVASAIAVARAKAGISQAQLASKSGIDQSDKSKLERGMGNPSVSTLNRLARAMGMELTIQIS